MAKMRANVFHDVHEIRVEEIERPVAGIGEAVIRATLTTICGTDRHIVRGEYPVQPGLIIGHEPVGVIEEIGPGVAGYKPGERVLVGAIAPCGQCRACLSGQLSQCGHRLGYEALGGWRFGNTIHGAQAEYLLVPYAQANLAKIPEGVSDEQAVLLADIVAAVKRLTDGGADVAIEALGTQETFEQALRCLRPGGTLSSLGVYSGKLQVPYDAFAAGVGDYRIVTTLCPGGKERMRRLLRLLRSGRFDPTPLLTYSFALDDIGEGYRVFGERLDKVLKVAIRP